MALQTAPERQVEIEEVEVEPIRVRVLPDGRMDSNNAAKYLNRAPKTLAMWRMQGIGPEWAKTRGPCLLLQEPARRLHTGRGRVMASTSPTKCEPPRTVIPGRLSCLFSSMKKGNNDYAHIHQFSPRRQ